MIHMTKTKQVLSTKKMVYIALLSAMAFVLTRFIQFPTALGYIHFGDSIIYLAAFLLGGGAAATVGAIGGGLSDLLSYPAYTLPTLIIKALVGFTAAAIFKKCSNKIFGMILAFVCGALIVAAGYYITEVAMTANFVSPLASVPTNFLQTAMSVPVPVIMYFALKDRVIK